MCVAILKLEDETLIAFNLNMVSRVDMNKGEMYFIHDGVMYTTSDSRGSARRLKLHPSVCGKDGVMLYSAEAMFEKFCNQ